MAKRKSFLSKWEPIIKGAQLTKAGKPHKFNAVRTEVDGISFDSKAEAHYYAQLRMLEKAGEIEGLELQPKFPIVVNGVKVCTYIADFRYRVVKGKSASLTVVADKKGVRTPVYNLKKKLVKAIYDIDITEV